MQFLRYLALHAFQDCKHKMNILGIDGVEEAVMEEVVTEVVEVEAVDMGEDETRDQSLTSLPSRHLWGISPITLYREMWTRSSRTLQ